MRKPSPDDPDGRVAELFAREVPEIGWGVVEIKALARNPGSIARVGAPVWTRARRAIVIAVVLLGAACGGGEVKPGGAELAQSAPPDSAVAVRAAIDTLTRAGAVDWIADSIVRRGDTITVWTGPRDWMATDRPTSGVSIIAPARVVSIRHILGG